MTKIAKSISNWHSPLTNFTFFHNFVKSENNKIANEMKHSKFLKNCMQSIYFHIVTLLQHFPLKCFHAVPRFEHFHTVPRLEHFHTVPRFEHFHTVPRLEHFHTVPRFEHFHTVPRFEHFHSTSLPIWIWLGYPLLVAFVASFRHCFKSHQKRVNEGEIYLLFLSL